MQKRGNSSQWHPRLLPHWDANRPHWDAASQHPSVIKSMGIDLLNRTSMLKCPGPPKMNNLTKETYGIKIRKCLFYEMLF